MRWISSAVCLFVVLLASTPRCSDAGLELQILDASGLAITGAAITVSTDGGATVNRQSDEAGRFQIGTLVPGRYQVTVMREGFATVTETMSVGPDTSPVAIRLEPAGLVENVTVSGSALSYRATEAEVTTRFDAPLLEQPQSVQVVTPRDYRGAPAATAQRRGVPGQRRAAALGLRRHPLQGSSCGDGKARPRRVTY
jgi:hypothetical protein